MDQPLVSIIVRTKDRPKLLTGALKSLAAQTYRPLQAVVVNDGGSALDPGKLQEILGDIELTPIEHPRNMGRAAAGNTGIAYGRGRYIGFLDDDDELYPEHVQVLTGYLIRSDLKIAYSDSLMVYKRYDPDSGEIITEREELLFSEDFDYPKLLFDNYIPLICLLFDREVLVESGGFDPAFELYEDHDLLLRLGEHHPFQHLKRTTAAYRQWSGAAQIAQAASESLVTQAHIRLMAKHLEKFTPERITRYRQALALAKDGHIRHLDRQLADRDWKIAGLESLVQQYEQIMAQKDQKIAGIESLLNLREGHLAELTGLFRQLQEQHTLLLQDIGAKLHPSEQPSKVSPRLRQAAEKVYQLWVRLRQVGLNLRRP